MASYEEALRWLYGLSARGVRLELDRMGGAVAHRGHPERDVPVVHVAGTNGKGSVCALIERALREAGYRTGHFASPHLHQFTERVRIDGEPLSEAEVAERLRELRSALPSMPPLTFFEIATLMAFETFRETLFQALTPSRSLLPAGSGGGFPPCRAPASCRIRSG